MIFGVEETPKLLPLAVHLDGVPVDFVLRAEPVEGWIDVMLTDLIDSEGDIPIERRFGAVRLFRDGIDVTDELVRSST
ncbi:MAG: hypothetical protein IPJ41_17800 [Phycisphaerales bacterium]|nr:hypothetical protein [Phycisphaerales bacterium]